MASRIESYKVGGVAEPSELFLVSLRQHTLYRREHRCDISEFGIEVAGIGPALDSGDEWWRYALVVDILPVDVAEKGVGHDLLCVGRTRSKTLFGFAGEQFLEYRDTIAWHVDGIEWFVSENGVVDFVLVFSAEWRLLQEHLVD